MFIVEQIPSRSIESRMFRCSWCYYTFWECICSTDVVVGLGTSQNFETSSQTFASENVISPTTSPTTRLLIQPCSSQRQAEPELPISVALKRGVRFCHTAIESATKDKEIVVMSQIQKYLGIFQKTSRGKGQNLQGRFVARILQTWELQFVGTQKETGLEFEHLFIHFLFIFSFVFTSSSHFYNFPFVFQLCSTCFPFLLGSHSAAKPWQLANVNLHI